MSGRALKLDPKKPATSNPEVQAAHSQSMEESAIAARCFRVLARAWLSNRFRARRLVPG